MTSIRTKAVLAALLAAAFLSTACDSLDPNSRTGFAAAEECPPPSSDVPDWPGDPERRIEEIVEHLTGISDDGPEGGPRVEDRIEDPNFGGVWGDFQGGIVVAVLDCSETDIEGVVSIAGGLKASESSRSNTRSRRSMGSEIS